MTNNGRKKKEKEMLARGLENERLMLKHAVELASGRLGGL